MTRKELFDNINKRISNQDIYEPKLENNKDLNPNEIKEIDLSKLPKINQTVYLRLYTEHCLYWIGYYNYSIEIINKFLFKFYGHPAFPIFCLNNQTALHGCCIQGSKIPFKELLNRYENKRAIREKLYGKSTKEIPQYMDNSGLKNFSRISYPVEYQQYQKKLETSIHFNSLNKKFKNYILKHYFKLIYPKSYVENLPLEKIVDNTIHHKYMFRICLIGNICVGKTSLLARYADNSFKESYANTIGVDFRVITLKYNDIIAKVHIWDTAGNERFKSITINYYRSSHGFIYVYDITSKESFENLDMWINLTNENCGTNAINFLVGNKSDLEKEREVSKEEGEEFAKKYDLIFIETSAKNNDNVGKLFEFFTYKLIEYYQKNTDKYIGNNSDTLDSFSQFTNLEINDKKSGCQC